MKTTRFHWLHPVTPSLVLLLALGGGTLSSLAQPKIQTQPQSQSNLVGSTFTYSVLASGAPPLTYQWREHPNPTVPNTCTNLPDATNDTLILSNVVPPDRLVSVVVTEFGGLSVTSVTAWVAPRFAPGIRVQPVSMAVELGSTFSCSVAATGSPPRFYQWYFNNVPLASQRSAILTIPNVQSTNAGDYFVTVTNWLGGVTSQVATLSVVRFPPGIRVQPTNQTLEVGSTYICSVMATGTPPLSYQWYFNNAPLATKTNSSLTIPNVQSANAGDYFVTVTNISGGITSQVATLRAIVPGCTLTKITAGVVVNDPGSYWGSAWVDYDQDGYMDLFVSSGGMTYSGVVNRLYRNNGDGTFTSMPPADVGALVGEVHQYAGCSWGDYDNDGWPDAYLFCLTNRLYRNERGVFQRVYDAGVGRLSGAQGGVWGDYDRDGWLDLFEGSAYQPYGQRNMLYHNEGDGAFSGLTTGPIYTDEVYLIQKSAWGDYDGDGWPDLVMTCIGQAGGAIRTYLYRNLGVGQFQRITDNAIVQDTEDPLCPSWADYDNDGRLDLFVGRFSGNPNKLFHNEGNGQFSVVLIGEGGQNGPAAWGDYDNDGDLDLFISRGQGADYRNQFFQNNGDGTFTELKTIAPATFTGRSHTGIWGDYDNDGFLDLFVPHLQTWGTSLLYHNEGNSNHWVLIKLVGAISNRSAIGARVKVLATIFGKQFWQMRDLGPNTSDGQNDPRAHFGLGNATNIEVLQINWPSGQVTEMRNVASKQILTITESPAIKPLAVAGGTFQFELRSHRGMAWDLHVSDHLHGASETCTCTNGYWQWQQCVTNDTGTTLVTDPNVQRAALRFYKALPH